MHINEKRGFKRTPYSYTTLVHALAVNIDMVCELSAALLCLCKKNKSCAKKFANLFSLCFVFSIRRHHHTDIQKLLLRLAISFFCRSLRDSYLVLSRVLVDETHILGENLLGDSLLGSLLVRFVERQIFALICKRAADITKCGSFV